MPPRERDGWSFIQKGSDIGVEELVEVLESAVGGVSRIETTWSTRPAVDVLGELSPRQREVMALAASGYDAVGIAERLHLAHVSVRRELSLAYRVLVPNPPAGTDLRTVAVLAYLRLMPEIDEPAQDD